MSELSSTTRRQALDPASATTLADARLVLLRERFAWMGQHSGYDVVFQEIAERWPGGSDTVWRHRGRWAGRLLGFAELMRPDIPFYNGDSLAAELALLRAARRRGSALAHVAYVENNLRHLSRRRRDSFALVGTAHQPARFWAERHRHPELLHVLDALIVLCRDQVDYFAPLLPGAVHLVRHGVDTDFFSPGSPEAADSDGAGPRCVFSGTWMRDLASLRGVVGALRAERSDLRFDLIVPAEKRGDPELRALADLPEVAWHGGLSNTELRQVYRAATLLLLPLHDATANNALLEAMACGLPVVASDVPGIRDYTTDDFADRIPPGDVDGLCGAVLRLVDDRAAAARRGLAACAYARSELRWEQAASQTMAVYASVLEARGPAR